MSLMCFATRLMIAVVIGTALACGERNSSSDRTEIGGSLAHSSTVLTVGTNDSLPGHALHRVVAAFLLPDGSLVVANGAPPELRIFDPRGGLKRTLGRMGMGPAEFTALGGAWPVIGSDTIIATDPIRGRITYWNLAKGYINTAVEMGQSNPQLGGTQIAGRTRDGSFWGVAPIPSELSPGVVVDSVSIMRVSAGAEPIVLGRAPWSVKFVSQLPQGKISNQLPFSPFGAIAVGGDAFFFGWTEDWRLVRFGSADVGRPDSISIHGPGRTPFEIEHWNRWQDHVLDTRPRLQRRDIRRMIAEYPIPSHFPAFDAVVVDGQERIWFRQYMIPGARWTHWIVATFDGEVITTGTLPARFRATQINTNNVVGVQMLPDGREAVPIYRLRE